MKKKRTLKKIFCFTFIFALSMVFISAAGIILIVIFQYDAIISGSVGEYLPPYLLLASLTFLFIAFIFACKPYFLDLKDVRANHFHQITGKVVGFATKFSPEIGSPPVPLILVEGTNNTIKLRIGSFAKIGETYTFIYLDQTKIGEIASKSSLEK